MSLIDAVFALLMPFGLLIYLCVPILPVIALARANEWLLAVIAASFGYGIPLVAAFTFTGRSDRIGSLAGVDDLLIYGSAIAAVTASLIVAAIYALAWRYNVLPPRKYF